MARRQPAAALGHVNEVEKANPSRQKQAQLQTPRSNRLVAAKQRCFRSLGVLVAANAAEKLLAVAVSRKADARAVSLSLDARPALPALKVELLNADILLKRLLVNKLLQLQLLFLLFLVVAARVLGTVAAQNFHGDADNHGEPDNGDDLQSEKRDEESPLDIVVEAYNAGVVVERHQKVAQALGSVQRADEVGVTAGVAPIVYLLRHVRIY